MRVYTLTASGRQLINKEAVLTFRFVPVIPGQLSPETSRWLQHPSEIFNPDEIITVTIEGRGTKPLRLKVLSDWTVRTLLSSEDDHKS